MNDYILYGAQVSLYTGKVRAYLRFKGIPYEERVASLKVMKSVIQPATNGLRIMPVVVTPEGDLIQDTTLIIDALEKRFPATSVYPTTPKQKLTALLFELFGDEWLLMPAMHYRWAYKTQNLAFLLKEFGHTINPDLPAFIRWLPGTLPAALFGKIGQKVLGLNPAVSKEVETRYEQFLRAFDAHLAEIPFLLGTQPSMGDFGLMGPLYAHLYRDPYPGKMMRRVAPRVSAWVERMNAPKVAQGKFLPNDEVPQTLEPILQQLFRDQFPIIKDIVARTDQWCQAHPDKPRIPRFIGEHDFRLGAATGRRKVIPYSQWMLQRPLDFYRGLKDPDLASVDALLQRVDGHACMQLPITQRVQWQAGRLWREEKLPA